MIFRRSHLAALAVVLAVLVTPRPLWDRLRLALFERLPRAHASDGELPGGAGRCRGPCEGCTALRGALAAAEAERASLAHALRQVAAVRDRLPGLAAGDAIPARAIAPGLAGGGPAQAGEGRLVLDAGRRDGVRLDLAVVTDGAALLGRVAAVTDAVCEVETVLSPSFRVRVRPLGKDLEGILRGVGLAGELRFRPQSPSPPRGGGRGEGAAGPAAAAELSVGDVLVTAERSVYAPGGLVVGEVTAIEHDPSEGVLEARVRPAASVPLERAVILTGGPRR